MLSAYGCMRRANGTAAVAMVAAVIVACAGAAGAGEGEGSGPGTGPTPLKRVGRAEPAAPATEKPLSGAVSLTLRSAVTYRTRDRQGGARERRDIQLDLVCREGKWQADAWGFMPEVPAQEHLGGVTASSEAEGRVQLRIALPIASSPSRPSFLGGGAMYELDLRRMGDGLVGTYRGTCIGTNRPEVLKRTAAEWSRRTAWGGWEAVDIDRVLDEWIVDGDVSGEAVGVVSPLPRQRAGFAAPRPGEHPRLLFRKADLPELQRLAETADGKRLIASVRAQLDSTRGIGPGETARGTYPPKRAGRGGVPPMHEALWGAGYGLLYQLAGDRDAVEQSKAWCRTAMFGSEAQGGGVWQAEQIMGVALCYDLFYDAWDAEFRDTAMLFLERSARQAVTMIRGSSPLRLGESVTFAGEMSFRPPADETDRVFARFRAAAGMAALAIAADPVRSFRGEGPLPPGRAKAIAPAGGDYEPPFGMPVVSFTDDAMPERWLIAGPFFPGSDGNSDPFIGIGGRAFARPSPGEAVRHHGVELEWRQLTLERATAAGKGEVPLGQAKLYSFSARTHGQYWTWSDAAGGYPKAADVSAALAVLGKRAGEPTVYLYTVLRNDAPRVVQGRPNWGYQSCGAGLWLNGVRLGDGELAALDRGYYGVLAEAPITGGAAAQAPRLAEYSERDWRRDAEAHRDAAAALAAAGGAMPGMDRHARAAVRSVRRFCAGVMGETGWAEFDDVTGSRRRVDYAETLKLVLPLLAAWGNVTGEDLAGETRVAGLAPLGLLCEARAFHNGRLFDVALPLTLGFADAKYRPAVRAALRQREDAGAAQPWQAMMVLPYLWEPRQAAGAASTAPADAVGLAAADERYGIHWLRSEWGKGDWLAMLHLGRVGRLGRQRAGTLSLNGAGADWLAGLDSGVQIAGAVAAGAADATGIEVQPGRTLTASMRLDDWRAGGVRLGVVVERAAAVDFSGACGAPVLVAVADVVRGAGRRPMAWQLGFGGLGGGSNAEVAEKAAEGQRGRTFNVRNGAGVIAGVVVGDADFAYLTDAGPAGAVQRPRRKLSPVRGATLRLTTYDPELLYKEMERQIKEGLAAKSAEETDEIERARAEAAAVEKMIAQAADDAKGQAERAERRFFAVMTIGKGEGPKIRVEETDEGVKATVGTRVVTWDGKKIVLVVVGGNDSAESIPSMKSTSSMESASKPDRSEKNK